MRTYVHTHTHIYIYIYIYEIPKLGGGVGNNVLRRDTGSAAHSAEKSRLHVSNPKRLALCSSKAHF